MSQENHPEEKKIGCPKCNWSGMVPQWIRHAIRGDVQEAVRYCECHPSATGQRLKQEWILASAVEFANHMWPEDHKARDGYLMQVRAWRFEGLEKPGKEVTS